MNSALGTLHDKVPQLWTQTLAAHRGWLSAVIFARVRDHHAVDEVLQETALAAAKNATPADIEGISKWLYRVAVRQSLLYRRRQRRHDQRIQKLRENEYQQTTENKTSPFAALVASEQVDLVRAALSNLAPRDCEILLLKYTEHWSCLEIANRLGVSNTAIKSRLLRARRNLRQQLLQVNEDWDLP